jgi:hypothetical protein
MVPCLRARASSERASISEGAKSAEQELAVADNGASCRGSAKTANSGARFTVRFP